MFESHASDQTDTEIVRSQLKAPGGLSTIYVRLIEK